MVFQRDPFAETRPSAGSGDGFAPEDVVRRLRWRARRGMLENDLFLERFFSRWGERLSLADHDGLGRLLDLTDNDLLDLFVGKVQPEGELDTPEVRHVLEKIRNDQP